MKKYFFKLFVLTAILGSISFSLSAQVYVKVRPPVPVMVRPPQPSPAHIWINEEWEPNGREYRYAGHWEMPPHPGFIRRQGHWMHHHRYGDRWVHGTWRRK